YNRSISFSEAINARNVIISKNTVLDIFKNNNYKTYFLAEKPYLLLNRPEIGYDECNFSYDDISYIGTGLGERQDILTPLNTYIEAGVNQPKFFFIEMFNPGHIQNKYIDPLETVKELWIESLNQANIRLENMVSSIKRKDPNALIIIMADHGGFIGMEYTNQIYIKTQDRDIIYSIFTSTLAIHWPNGIAPEYDTSFKTAVNVFRIVFSYLSEDESYLSNLQEDGSYVVINKEAPKGIYKYIDNNGKITFIKQ
ncbi:MAG: hypothetical protein IMY67_05780, partial [Bacteroidetes bacterium]|nr:hypothetical protein [Bacteroidota bacterium]